MKPFFRLVLILMVLATLKATAGESVPTGSFAFESRFSLPGTPDAIYDAATGDISEWWDHSMSESPLEMVIEARPGGAFREIFDESGDGVQHATVTYAQRGKMLRMEGPMGLAGAAVTMVTTWTLEAEGDQRTLFTVTVRATGEIQDNWAGIVEKTWRHFIDQQLRNHLE